MKIISWNVNGIRAILKKGFVDFVKNNSPDVLCLQEVKCFENQLPKEIRFLLNDYDFFWHRGEKSGYAGTSILHRKDLNIISKKNNFDFVEKMNDDGRITQLEFDDFVLLNIYFPNGGTRANGQEMLTYKLDYYDIIIKYVNEFVRNGKEVVMCGDFNIAHKEIDIARPKQNKDSIGFLPIEREKFTEMLDNGYIDVFRKFNPDKKDYYTRWSYRAGSRPRNVGWRLDYFVCSQHLEDKIDRIEHMDQVYGSDHCPVLLEIDI